jgi:hypothetical protein
MHTPEDRARWIKVARSTGAQYVTIVTDQYDPNDYPVFCKDYETALKIVEFHADRTSSVVEIIKIDEEF